MNKDKTFIDIKSILDVRQEILFGYIHGSIISSDNPGDVDVAVFIDRAYYEEMVAQGELNMGYAIPLEMAMERGTGEKVDVQVLNGAPLGFKYQVMNSGKLIIDRDSDTRADFEGLTRVQYFDFRPRVQEYLREIAA